MSDPMMAEIKLFGGNFPPRGWAFCDGQLLPISQFDALFSILGTIYGGDGRTTFALPDLRGRAPIHPGNGPGLTTIALGSKGGAETHTHSVSTTVTSGEAPHTHEIPGTPAGAGLTPTSAANVDTPQSGSGTTGPTNHRSPYLAMNYIIALEGIYPSRS